MKLGDIERGANDTVRRVVTLQQGIPTEAGREIVKFLKDKKLRKVQPAIQGDQLRISSPSRDELQSVMALLREQDFGVDCSSATTASSRDAAMPNVENSSAATSSTTCASTTPRPAACSGTWWTSRRAASWS